MADEGTPTPASAPVEDQWTRWDYPVLLALARWDAEDQLRTFIDRAQIVQMVGVAEQDAWKVGRALDRLHHAGLIEAEYAGDGTPWPSFVMRVTVAGLQRAGAWPSPEAFRDRFLAELEVAADRMAETEPEKSKRLRAVVEFFRVSAVEIISEVTTKLLKPGP